MSAFLGLNLDEPFCLLSSKIAFLRDGIYFPGLAYPGVMVSRLRATNFPRVGIDLVAHGSSDGPI
jgi:hypothetical protein